MADFKTFYYDIALSAYNHTLTAMEAFVGSERVLYGSDFPGKVLPSSKHLDCLEKSCIAVSKQMVSWYSANAEEFYRPEQKEAVMRTNLLRLLSNVNI